MKFNKQDSSIFIPSGKDIVSALKDTTHLCIAAHQDDVEIMAYDGIAKCFQQSDLHFSAVIVTNGSGSARDNIYKDYTDEEMITVRKKEQIKASIIGEYASLSLLMYPSKEVKDKSETLIVSDLLKVLQATKPDVVYTHNLADKHDTHIGVVVKTIKALRMLNKEDRPKQVLGCEVWRALDWVNDNEKVFLDVSKHPNLAASLVEVFDSQIIGGKRYDKGAIGRRLANATFSSSHEIDASDQVTYAMDLTELMNDESLDIKEFIEGYINRFKEDVFSKIDNVL